MTFGAAKPTPDIGQPETVIVEGRVVACDGDGPLGHPRVWLRIVDRQTFCPWCSRIFVLNPAAEHDDGH